MRGQGAERGGAPRAGSEMKRRPRRAQAVKQPPKPPNRFATQRAHLVADVLVSELVAENVRMRLALECAESALDDGCDGVALVILRRALGREVVGDAVPPGSDCVCGRYQDEPHMPYCPRRAPR